MSYHPPNSLPSRPSTPIQFSRYPSQFPDRQCSRSPPPHSHISPGYPTLCPQLLSGPRRCCSPPPRTSPLSDYQQPNTPPYPFVNASYTGSGIQGLQYREQRRNSTGMMQDGHRCARILDVELEKPRKKSSAAAALLVKVSRYPEHLDPIPHNELLHMFQHLYGSMLDTVKHLTRDLLRIEDLSAVSCKATVCRFDKRDTWRVHKSRSGVQDHFYCAPYIEVTLPYFPTRAAVKEIIAAVMDSYGTLAKHMQPAFKFRTRTYSWKFEPGAVYESVDAEHFIAKPVVDEDDEDDDINQEEEHQQSESPKRKAITYPGYTGEGSSATSPGNGLRKLDDIKEELRFGPNKDQCRETVKALLANEFLLDPRRITVWFWVKEVQLHDGKWYPWGSLDNTYGLTIVSQEVVPYSPEDAKKSARRSSRSSRAAKDKEPCDIAPTVRVILPVERTKFAKDEENVRGLKECVQSIRSQMSTISNCHSRAAFCISWKKERREYADWIAPQVVYKPTGDGDNYVLEDTGASQR